MWDWMMVEKDVEILFKMSMGIIDELKPAVMKLNGTNEIISYLKNLGIASKLFYQPAFFIAKLRKNSKLFPSSSDSLLLLRDSFYIQQRFEFDEFQTRKELILLSRTTHCLFPSSPLPFPSFPSPFPLSLSLSLFLSFLFSFHFPFPFSSLLFVSLRLLTSFLFPSPSSVLPSSFFLFPFHSSDSSECNPVMGLTPPLSFLFNILYCFSFHLSLLLSPPPPTFNINKKNYLSSLERSFPLLHPFSIFLPFSPFIPSPLPLFLPLPLPLFPPPSASLERD